MLVSRSGSASRLSYVSVERQARRAPNALDESILAPRARSVSGPDADHAQSAAIPLIHRTLRTSRITALNNIFAQMADATPRSATGHLPVASGGPALDKC